MATIKEIAMKAGVSIGTVDRVLHNRGAVSEKTKARVQKVMEELAYRPNQAAQALAIRKRELRLCVFMPGIEGHPFYKAVREAVEKKTKELREFGVHVEICSMEYEPEERDNVIENWMLALSEVDGISVIDGEWNGLNEYLDEAERRSIPIVAYNMWNDRRNYLACVGCDYIQSGALAAGLSALIGGEKAEICVFSEGLEGQTEITDSYEGRMKGFEAEIVKRYPDMKIRETCFFTNDQIDNYLKVKEMLCKYPQMNIAYVVNPGNYSICEAIYRADEKHQLHIITNDFTQRLKEMMQTGMIAATICQEPEKQGALPLEILFEYLAYGTVPENKIHYTSLSIHIAQNV